MRVKHVTLIPVWLWCDLLSLDCLSKKHAEVYENAWK
jgi:hypothetical protein